ncbi:MAG TPA: transcriptional regulator, partial [Actinomycetota bacterium]
MVVDQIEVDRLFQALADATRRDIVRRTMDGSFSVSTLARDYP